MLTQERIKTLAGSVSYGINGPLLTLYKYAHIGDWDETKECEIEENRIAERNSSCILNDAARPLIYSKQRIF
jgi:hypothetical protein